MNLYLLRHGIAEDAPSGEADEDRELTDEGRKKLTDLLQVAAHAGVQPDCILTSPYKRAEQTARLAARVLKGPEPMDVEALVPHGTPHGLWNEVRAHQQFHDIVISSHEPLLSQAVSYLLSSPALQVEMKKGAMVALEFNSFRGEPRGTLKWMLIPKLCS